MNTCWVFGDSFANLISFSQKKQWFQIVAENCNLELKTYGVSGSSLSYTYNKFNHIRNFVKSDDVIIVCLTNFERRWFFEENPEMGASQNLGRSRDETNAIKKYRIYLDNNKLQEMTYLEDFLYNLHYLTEKKNCRTVILPCFFDTLRFLENIKEQFPLFNIANSALADEVHESEFAKDFTEWWRKLPHGSRLDARANHMLFSNHVILADKIVDCLKNKEQIDLTTDLIKQSITLDKKYDTEWRLDEILLGDWNAWAKNI